MRDIYFPFKTCEEPNKNTWIAQPVSAFINMITSIILIYFFLKAKTLIIKLLILSFIAFEIFHTYSHIKHINGAIQSNIIHGIWYFLTFMILIASVKMTNKYPNLYTKIILLLINEKYNCEYMIKYAKLPYHAIIEIIGMLLFIILSYVFLKSEKYLK